MAAGHGKAVCDLLCSRTGFQWWRMKAWSFALVSWMLALAGCESVSTATSGVRERITPREEPRTRKFDAQPRLVYEAVRAAAGQMGYRFVRGGPAQGEFEAMSGVREGEAVGSSRQLTMKVTMRRTLDGTGTDMTLRITEIIEPDSSHRAGQATEAPLRDSPQYEVFFRRVEQALGAAKAVP